MRACADPSTHGCAANRRARRDNCTCRNICTRDCSRDSRTQRSDSDAPARTDSDFAPTCCDSRAGCSQDSGLASFQRTRTS